MPARGQTDFSIRRFGLEKVAEITAVSADVNWHQPEAEIAGIIRRSGKYLWGAFHQDKLIGVAAAYPYPAGVFAALRNGAGKNALQKKSVFFRSAH